MSLLLLLDDEQAPRRRDTRAGLRRGWRGYSALEGRMRKPVGDQWREADLALLVADRIQEDGELEYKQSRALQWADDHARDQGLNSLSKNVSAFANANGGLLIVGIEEDKHVPVKIDEGLDPRTHGRAWLEDLIRGNVRDCPPELRVHEVPLADGSRVAHVVAVPMFPRGCQARDRRYYRRRNFRVDMLDDWEVRELLSRAVQASVAVEVGYVDEPGDIRKLIVRLTNTGTVRVQDWKFQVDVPEKVIVHSIGRGEGRLVQVVWNTTEGQARRYVAGNWGGGGPLFPGQAEVIFGPGAEGTFLRFRWNPEVANFAYETGAAVRWVLYADDLPSVASEVPIASLSKLPSDRS
jgi:hypothetical protein